MAASIKQQFGIDSELVKGSGGIFDVYRDETLIYSKHKTGRFPSNDEILAALKT